MIKEGILENQEGRNSNRKTKNMSKYRLPFSWIFKWFLTVEGKSIILPYIIFSVYRGNIKTTINGGG